MIKVLDSIARFIGNTPTYDICCDKYDLFVKLEYYNYSGSIKDRPALNILRNAIQQKKIEKGSAIVESSSGNFAIALASICARLSLRFIAVIDPVINSHYERLLNVLCHEVVKVSERDETGGYLLTRLKTVKSILSKDSNIFWTNQYENRDNYLAYFDGLGAEIGLQIPHLDYAFIGVSTGGTITGLSRRLKEIYPNIRIIAVDIVGSVIFGGKPAKRYISGIGASIVSPVLQMAKIDEVVYVSQAEVLDGCHALLQKYSLFGGASTGAVYSAVQTYFSGKEQRRKPKVLFLCTDKGTGYLDTVYDNEWNDWLRKISENIKSSEENVIHP